MAKEAKEKEKDKEEEILEVEAVHARDSKPDKTGKVKFSVCNIDRDDNEWGITGSLYIPKKKFAELPEAVLVTLKEED
ncbi:MAG: hypothetical protein KJ556_20050 [Gammaproteobacteria bacterium]|nr:hypothetical protein [Gammaproteobacteria bacterium]